MFTLYYVPAGSASCRVRFCLAEKHIQYEGKLVDIKSGEQHSPEYLQLNPIGLIPTLVHDGKPVWESAVICEYLDDVVPDFPVRPTDPYALSVMRNWVKHMDEQCVPALIVFNWTARVTPYAKLWSDAELEKRLERIPTPARRAAWLRAARNPYTEEEKTAAWATLMKFVDKMSAALKNSPWLVGSSLSIADMGAASFIWRIQAIAPNELDDEKYSDVRDWWARMKKRDGFAAAFTEPFGTADKP